ncbi:MAG: isopropylmalate isomerase [Erythrobacter sp.]
MSDKPTKKSGTTKTAAATAAAIGSAAIAAALLYAGRRFLKKADDAKTPPTIPSGEPPETD